MSAQTKQTTSNKNILIAFLQPARFFSDWQSPQQYILARGNFFSNKYCIVLWLLARKHIGFPTPDIIIIIIKLHTKIYNNRR
jgi:hypothetical protein